MFLKQGRTLLSISTSTLSKYYWLLSQTIRPNVHLQDNQGCTILHHVLARMREADRGGGGAAGGDGVGRSRLMTQSQMTTKTRAHLSSSMPSCAELIILHHHQHLPCLCLRLVAFVLLHHFRIRHQPQLHHINSVIVVSAAAENRVITCSIISLIIATISSSSSSPTAAPSSSSSSSLISENIHPLSQPLMRVLIADNDGVAPMQLALVHHQSSIMKS